MKILPGLMPALAIPLVQENKSPFAIFNLHSQGSSPFAKRSLDLLLSEQRPKAIKAGGKNAHIVCDSAVVHFADCGSG